MYPVGNNSGDSFHVGDTHGLILDFGVWWNTLSPSLQYQIAWLITLAGAIFFITSVIVLFFHGASSNISSIDRNIERKTHSLTGVVSVVITFIVTGLGVGLLFSLYF